VAQKYKRWRYSSDDVSHKRTKTFLRELNKQNPNIRQVSGAIQYHKYYEHAPQISQTISGKPPPQMDLANEEKMRLRFRQIQIPFEACPLKLRGKRRNFLSYAFTLYKLCELEENDEFLQCFPLLKSKDRLRKHDIIWKFICEWNRWQYIPSL
jgi:hypothetical protein